MAALSVATCPCLTGLYDRMVAQGIQNPFLAPEFAATATAGIPGTWGPADTVVPTTVAALIAGSPKPVTASPATAWTTGQYVQTQTAGVPGRASWNGTAWVAGAAP